MQNEYVCAASDSITTDGAKQASTMGGAAAAAPGGAGGPAADPPFLYLLLTSEFQSEKKLVQALEKLLGGRTAIARKADTLRRNFQDMIDRNGVEHIGFMTLTFKDNVRCRKLAEKRFHSFAINVLAKLVEEYIAVPERQERGAIHYHLAVAFGFDIRTGFDLEECSAANMTKKHGYLGNGKWLPGYQEKFLALEQNYFASANPALKRVWRLIRQANARIEKRNCKFGRTDSSPAFGRCETLPVLSNADAIAFYIGTYITSQTEQRAPEDKGMRSVRYSLKLRRHHQSFHFAYGGDAKWRHGCKILALLLLIHDEPIAERVGKKLVFHYAKDHVRSRFGPRWPHKLAPWIFACYDNGDVCKAFAKELPADLAWRERLVKVGQFMDRLRCVGLSTPVAGVLRVAPIPAKPPAATIPLATQPAMEINRTEGKGSSNA
jgi:hypothetical protein